MKFIDILRDRIAEIDTERSAKVAELEAITEAAATESRSALTDVEDAEFERVSGEIAGLDAERSAKMERLSELSEIEARQKAAAIVPAAPVPGTAADPTDVDVRRIGFGEARDRALRVLDTKDATRHLDAGSLDKVDRLVRNRNHNCDGAVIARRLLITESDAYRSAFMKASTQTSPAFTADEARALDEFRAASIGTDAAGGYGVPVLIDPTIILTSQGSLNPFRAISRVETITNDEWKGVSSAGVSWSYDGEATAVSDDTPTLAQPTVTAHKAQGFIPYSIEVGMDYPGFAAEMSRLLGEGYDELQAEAFATGTGSSQPFGILTALDANTNVEVAVTTDGSFGGVDVNAAWSALPDRYRQNSTWVMSHDVGAEVATFGNSNNLSFVTVDLTGIVETLRTRPVRYSSYFPTFTGTTSARNILVVGDFRNYLIAERAGMSVELVPHLFDVTNNRPTGQRGWFAWARHGADSINDLGFRLLQNQ